MRKETGALLLLVILCIVVAVLNPRFLSGANLQNMARLIGAFGIFSIGAGIVIITGGIITDYSLEQRENLRKYAQGYIKKPFGKNELLSRLKILQEKKFA